MAASTPAPLWDLVSAWMHSEDRPQDFVWITEIRGMTVSDLAEGAARAHAQFPTTQARLQGEAWVPADAPDLHLVETPEALMQALLPAPSDPRQHPPLIQAAAPSPDGAVLGTRVHHALADLAGVLLFLDAQLGGEPRADPLELQSHPAPARKQPAAHAGRSRRLWTRRSPGAAAPRRVLTITLDPAPLEARAKAWRISYNDLLARAFLDALADHQRAHGAPESRLSLWLPINVRRRPFDGFGNGTSRLRIYRDPLGPDEAPEVRGLRLSAQRQAATEAGEWCVPTARPAPGLPLWLVRPPLLAYLRRPWVDMGSAPFSHAHRLGPPGRLAALEPGDLVMNLHPWHPVGVAGVTHAGRTTLSFTWDPGQWDAADTEQLVQAFRHRVEQA